MQWLLFETGGQFLSALFPEKSHFTPFSLPLGFSGQLTHAEQVSQASILVCLSVILPKPFLPAKKAMYVDVETKCLQNPPLWVSVANVLRREKPASLIFYTGVYILHRDHWQALFNVLSALTMNSEVFRLCFCKNRKVFNSLPHLYLYPVPWKYFKTHKSGNQPALLQMDLNKQFEIINVFLYTL